MPWPEAGQVQASVQLDHAVVPVLVMAILAPKPPCHWLLTVYVTWQNEEAACVAEIPKKPLAVKINALTSKIKLRSLFLRKNLLSLLSELGCILPLLRV